MYNEKKGETVHVSYKDSVQAGLSQLILLSLMFSKVQDAKLFALEITGNKTVVVSSKNTFEVASWFLHSCRPEGFSEFGSSN